MNGLVILFEGRVYKAEKADNFYFKCNFCDLARQCNMDCIEGYNTFCDFWRKRTNKGAFTNTEYLHFKEVKL